MATFAPVAIKNKLDKITNGESDDEELIFDKIKFLSACFEGLVEEELLSLAGAMNYMKTFQTESSLHLEDSIIWALPSDKAEKVVYIHYSVQMEDSDDKFQGKDNSSYYILPLHAIDEFNYQFPDNSVKILKYIDKYEEIYSGDL